jgi:hypothetical protein
LTGEQAGGGLTPVVRVGETIRRAAGPWTPAVHALLDHLAAVGFEGAPRVHGYDDDGREVIGFVEGEIRSDCDDEELAAIAGFVRRLHDSTTSFQPPSDARWQGLVGSPDGGDVICHNDLSPANTVWSRGLRERSSTGILRRPDREAGTSPTRSTASSRSIPTTIVCDSKSGLDRGPRGSMRSAARMGSTPPPASSTSSSDAFARSTTVPGSGAKPEPLAGPTFGGLRGESSGFGRCALSSNTATNGFASRRVIRGRNRTRRGVPWPAQTRAGSSVRAAHPPRREPGGSGRRSSRADTG